MNTYLVDLHVHTAAFPAGRACPNCMAEQVKSGVQTHFPFNGGPPAGANFWKMGGGLKHSVFSQPRNSPKRSFCLHFEDFPVRPQRLTLSFRPEKGPQTGKDPPAYHKGPVHCAAEPVQPEQQRD